MFEFILQIYNMCINLIKISLESNGEREVVEVSGSEWN